MKRILAGVAVMAALAIPSIVIASLGVTISPATLYAGDGTALIILNRSTEPATFDLTTTNGWAVAPAAFALAPQARQTVRMTSIGSGRSHLTVTVTGTAPVALGRTRGIGELSSVLCPNHTARGCEPPAGSWTLLLVIGGSVIALGLLWWRRKKA